MTTQPESGHQAPEQPGDVPEPAGHDVELDAAADPGAVSVPAPRPAKPRLLQDGRDMFWSIAPLVAICVVLAGVLGMCSFAPSGPGAGPAPAYDAPAALQADAAAPHLMVKSMLLDDSVVHAPFSSSRPFKHLPCQPGGPDAAECRGLRNQSAGAFIWIAVKNQA